jgi:hypothetical protein
MARPRGLGVFMRVSTERRTPGCEFRQQGDPRVVTSLANGVWRRRIAERKPPNPLRGQRFFHRPAGLTGFIRTPAFRVAFVLSLIAGCCLNVPSTTLAQSGRPTTSSDTGLPPALFSGGTVDPGVVGQDLSPGTGVGWDSPESAATHGSWGASPGEPHPGEAGGYEHAWGCDPGEWGWHVLPRGIVYKSYLAAAKESRLGSQIVHERDLGALFDSTLGGRFGVLRFGPEYVPEGFQWDIDGAAMVRLDPENELDVQATDYRVGSTLNWGLGKHRWRVGYYHVSSHLGDEFLLKNPGFRRLNFHRDAFLAGYSHYFTPDFRVYGEFAVAFNMELAEPFEFLFGFDWAPAAATGPRGAPFVAFNSHLRQELDFGGNIALQAGWAWRGKDPASGLLRTGLYYYNGGSPQWSFFQDFEEQLGVGLWYDF